MAGIACNGPWVLGPRTSGPGTLGPKTSGPGTLGPKYLKSQGPRGQGPKVLGALGPRPLGPWDLRYLGPKVRGPEVRGPKAQGLMTLESFEYNRYEKADSRCCQRLDSSMCLNDTFSAGAGWIKRALAWVLYELLLFLCFLADIPKYCD